jgi:hypothetical protein
MGTVDINEDGGFSNWTAPGGNTLAYREIWLLGLTPAVTTPVREQLAEDLDFSLSPNPASDQIRLHFEDYELKAGSVSVFSTAGKRQYESIITGPTLYITTQDWPAGLYFVKVLIDGKIKTKSLLIQ